MARFILKRCARCALKSKKGNIEKISWRTESSGIGSEDIQFESEGDSGNSKEEIARQHRQTSLFPAIETTHNNDWDRT
jgi:hypothetical protein